ncbi:MAG: MoaD/ThiS family protein [Halioglobus sp.]
MVKVVFFARIREQLGCAELDAEVSSLATLLATLKQRGELWSRVLSEPNLICAVNQVVFDGDDRQLQEGDEVAFFPPVTGG